MVEVRVEDPTTRTKLSGGEGELVGSEEDLSATRTKRPQVPAAQGRLAVARTRSRSTGTEPAGREEELAEAEEGSSAPGTERPLVLHPGQSAI